MVMVFFFFFFQAEDVIRDLYVTGVQTCALPICSIAAMGDFDKIWLLTAGGPGDRTTTITLFTYKTGFSAFDIGRTAAIAWIFVAVVMLVSAPLLRYLFKNAAEDR